MNLINELFFYFLIKIVLIDDYFCNIEECPTNEDLEIGDEEEDEEDDVDDENLYGDEGEEEKEEGNRQDGEEEEEVKY